MNEHLHGIPVGCEDCKHLNQEMPMLCAAFPNGIPIWIRGKADSHLTPQPGDHGIQFEPSDEFLKMLDETGVSTGAPAPRSTNEIEDDVEGYARVSGSDIGRALELIAEADPELLAMVDATAEEFAAAPEAATPRGTITQARTGTLAEARIANAAFTEWQATGATAITCPRCGGRFRFEVFPFGHRVTCERSDFEQSVRF